MNSLAVSTLSDALRRISSSMVPLASRYVTNPIVKLGTRSTRRNVRIRFVCGTAAAKRTTLLVADVHEFPGHIACDAASNSEIVVPIIVDGALYGVLDIDSPLKNRFDQEDQQFLEAFVHILEGQLAL